MNGYLCNGIAGFKNLNKTGQKFIFQRVFIAGGLENNKYNHIDFKDIGMKSKIFMKQCRFGK
jgi:hypothetical protein